VLASGGMGAAGAAHERGRLLLPLGLVSSEPVV